LTSLGFWALAPAIERQHRRLPGLRVDEAVFFEFGLRLRFEGAFVRAFYFPFPPSHPSFSHLSAFPPFLVLLSTLFLCLR
jgi:hypothetical protein